MKKRISCRAIIIEDNKMYVFYRRKINDSVIKEYYAIPGGGLEENETLTECVIRELKEEFQVEIEVLGYLGSNETEKTIEHFFDCKIKKGIPKLGGEELQRSCQENYYEITAIELSKLKEINISFKDIIEKALKKEYQDLIKI